MNRKKINVAVVGIGWWAAYNHLPTLEENEYVGRIIVVDKQAHRLAKIKEHFNIAATYLDIDRMLASEDIDGVIIATPHPSHYPIAKRCIEQGIHLLIEKPMTTRIEDARELVDLAAANSVQVLVACGWNYTDYMYKACQNIKDGRIGEIKHVVAQMASPTGDLFAGKPMEGTEADIFRPHQSTWADPGNAGGYSWGQMSHLLAALFYLIDEDPRSVFASFRLSSAGVDYYDAAVLKTNKSTTICLSGAANMPKNKGYMIDIRIFGTEGILALDIERERMVVLSHDGKDIEHEMKEGDGKYPEKSPVHRFIALCRGEKIENPANVVVGRRSVETLALMHKSAKSGKEEWL